MMAGHRYTCGRAQGRVAERVFPPQPPDRHNAPIAHCHVICATIPRFFWIAENYSILYDASWCPKSRRCIGAVAVFCPNTLRFQIYSVNIPMRVDNACKAELYTAWVGLSTRGPSNGPTFTFRSSSWHFADCKGCIMAQEGRQGPVTHYKEPATCAPRVSQRSASPSPPLLPHHSYLARHPIGPGRRS